METKLHDRQIAVSEQRKISATANLPLRNWRDPAENEVKSDVDDADDPERLGIIGAVINKPKDDAEDDAAEVTGRACRAGDNTVGVRVDVRDEAEVGAVAGLEKYGHQRDKAKHGRQVLGVQLPDDDQEGAREQATNHDEYLLRPEAPSRHLIQDV